MRKSRRLGWHSSIDVSVTTENSLSFSLSLSVIKNEAEGKAENSKREHILCMCVCVLVAGFVWYMKWAADILKMFEWDERGGEKGSMKIYDGYNEVGLSGILRGFCSRRWPIDILKCRHVFFIHSLCVASFSFRLLWMNQIESCYFSLQFHFGAAADICLWCCSVLDRCSCFFFVFF